VATVARHNDVEWLVYEHDDPVDPVATIDHGAEVVVPLSS